MTNKNQEKEKQMEKKKESSRKGLWAVVLLAVFTGTIIFLADKTSADQEKYAKTARQAKAVISRTWAILETHRFPANGIKGQYSLQLIIGASCFERVVLFVPPEHPNFNEFQLLVNGDFVPFILKDGVKSQNLADHLRPPNLMFQRGERA